MPGVDDREHAERGSVEDQPQRVAAPCAPVSSTLQRLVFDTAAFL